jgi:amino acid transporter
VIIVPSLLGTFGLVVLSFILGGRGKEKLGELCLVLGIWATIIGLALLALDRQSLILGIPTAALGLIIIIGHFGSWWLKRRLRKKYRSEDLTTYDLAVGISWMLGLALLIVTGILSFFPRIAVY